MTNASSQKKCPACGLTKPISAFLVLQPTLTGGQYAAICNSCRKSHALMTRTNPPHGEGDSETASRSEHRLDHKSKLASDNERQQSHKNQQELDSTLEKTQEQEQERKLDKKEQALKNERRHRLGYLSRDPLHLRKKDDRLQPKSAATADTPQARKQQELKTQEQRREHEKQTEQQKEIDEINTVNPLQQTGPQIKFQSTVFQQFKAWLGKCESAPIVRNLEHADQTKQLDNKKTSGAAPNKPTVEEYITRNFTKK